MDLRKGTCQVASNTTAGCAPGIITGARSRVWAPVGAEARAAGETNNKTADNYFLQNQPVTACGINNSNFSDETAGD